MEGIWKGYTLSFKNGIFWGKDFDLCAEPPLKLSWVPHPTPAPREENSPSSPLHYTSYAMALNILPASKAFQPDLKVSFPYIMF